jgi:NADH-quinone oxidoreductase subunit L
MGGLRRTLPRTYWPFLAGALCLAGFPLTGGFFSKDGILAAVWAHGDPLYLALYLLALLTAFLTAFYTFRMVWLVFGGEGAGGHNGPAVAGRVPRLMELTLVPLALLGLCGGPLNLPAWLGEGVLGSFLAPVSGAAPHHLAVGSEIALQLVAALVAVAGILLAGYRYGDRRRAARLAEAQQPVTGVAAFLLHGWYLDRLYDLLIVRPFGRASAWLWHRVDEGCIDGSVDRCAASLGRGGELLGRWTSGRVSLYLLSFAAGAAFVVAWLVWRAP